MIIQNKTKTRIIIGFAYIIELDLTPVCLLSLSADYESHLLLFSLIRGNKTESDPARADD